MSIPSARHPNLDRPVSGAGAVALTLGGIAAAFSVAACCGLPFLLATLGLGTAWLGGLAVLAAPHRALLLAAAAICLAEGTILLWRQRTARACAPATACANPAAQGATVVGLLLGLALLYLGYAYA